MILFIKRKIDSINIIKKTKGIMTKDIYKRFDQYNTDILYYEYKYFSPVNINTQIMDVNELGIYRNKIHYIGLFYLYIYNKKDLDEKKKLFFDKYFQYFFYEKLKIVSSSVIENIAELKKLL